MIRPDGVEAANPLPLLDPRFCRTNGWGQGDLSRGGEQGPVSLLADLCLSKHTPSAFPSFTVSFFLPLLGQRSNPPPSLQGAFSHHPALPSAPALLSLCLCRHLQPLHEGRSHELWLHTTASCSASPNTLAHCFCSHDAPVPWNQGAFLFYLVTFHSGGI